jgi:integrase
MHVRLYIRKPLGHLGVRDVTRATVRKWLSELRRQDGKAALLSDGTKALILATLSSILDLAVDDELISSNPCKTLARRHKPRQGKITARLLSDKERDALLAACNRFEWLRPIIRTALLGALRLGEIVGLDWRDVDFERNVIIVRQNYGKDGRLGTPKSGRVEHIPLHPELRKVLLQHYLLAEHGRRDDPVFVTAVGTRRRPNEVARAFRNARAKAALSEEPRALRFHDLRHSTITRLANQPGAVLPQVQRFARHASLQTTLGYIHQVDDATWLDEAAAALAGF